MKVALSTIGKFHTFDLARELHARGHELTVFTGYPRFKLRGERLPDSVIRTFPWLHAPCVKLGARFGYDRAFMRELVHWSLEAFGRHVERNIPECDVYAGLSSSAGNAGRIVKARGAAYICDRGSSHIRIQDQILAEEYARWGMPYKPNDPRVIAREEREYAEADMITVPSSFAYRSFLDAGVSERKLRLIPYGVDLSRFQKVGEPSTETFDVLFVGGVNLRKGIPYLLQAFAKVTHRARRLTIVGACDPDMQAWLRTSGLPMEHVTLTGSVPQPRLKEYMSRSHVMVLPSVEEGLALVQAQALACGCPVIGTHNSGGEDLFTDGEEGYIVPIRDADALAQRMQNLADEPWLQQIMGAAALSRVRRIGGWSTYGGRVAALMEELATRRPRDAKAIDGALAAREIGTC
ncbi:glycosyltransferase family 4 protein [Cupriavidus agavae]|uniref:Glycosyltransferase involved in cell wall biosynthesis n=1 Tax=Cupriavidus agavae TaxID=1001822 RepID=A0A4Q7RF69_9BURK|nr:glycosyltransferase family 4 protein [Cupriavidus agavae]RZT31843.1 glycosyltransferase involved in cell wall biosynthesis [Cupriavidus agavae]